jgi:predicted permease
MIFLHAMEGLISIIIMVSLGYILTANGWFSEENARLLPRIVSYIALPAYMLWNLLSTFDKNTFLPLFAGIIVPVISMLTSFVIGFFISNILGLAPNKKGTFRSVFFCSSSVFVGVPINLALFGEISLPYVLVYFLANASMFWTIGNYSISLSGRKPPAKLLSLATLTRVFSPPFMGFILAVVLILLSIQLPDFIMNTCKYLGGMTTPLSMLFIGIAMFSVNLRKITLSKDIITVLIGRFVVSPLAVLVIASFFPIPELMKKVFVIQAALPGMSQTTVLAKLYEADTEYAALLVSITTLFAVLAIPVYMVILG